MRRDEYLSLICAIWATSIIFVIAASIIFVILALWP
jgi:hypothetical protein